jgi:hypothetical protein
MATEIFGQSDAFGDIARNGPLRPLWFHPAIGETQHKAAHRNEQDPQE